VARSDATSPDIAAAKIVGVYGIKGWVKLKVNLESPASLTSLQPQFLIDARNQGRKPVRVLNIRAQGKGYVALLEGVDDRNAAELLRGYSIVVPKSALPTLKVQVVDLHSLMQQKHLTLLKLQMMTKKLVLTL